MKELIIEKASLQVYEFLNRNVKLDDPATLLVATTSGFNVVSQKGNYNTIINLSKVNNIRYINKFFNQVNAGLKNEDRFICCFETIIARKEGNKLGNLPVIGNFFFTFEFVFLRVFPKIWGLKKIYFAITKGRDRLLSRAEVLGRLVSCGFEIISYDSFDGLNYVVCKKIKEPDVNPNVSYGPIFKMQRMGKTER